MSQPQSMTLRRALGSFATGVTVVTAQGTTADVGVTANSFSSVSLEPPMVLWSLKKSSTSLTAFTESGAFAVHVLAAHQQALSDRFAKPAANKFEGMTIRRGFGGAPLLDDCAARFQCRLAFRYDGGDHEILVGEIVEFEHTDHPPLVFHGGRYGAISVPAQRGNEDVEDAGALMELVGRAYHWLFRSARQEFARRGLTEDSFFVLRLLGRDEGQTFDSLALRLSAAGRRLMPDVTDDLQRRGLIAANGAALSITAEGKRELLELTAVRLSAEQAAMAHLDRSELTVIKDLLRRLIQ